MGAGLSGASASRGAAAERAPGRVPVGSPALSDSVRAGRSGGAYSVGVLAGASVTRCGICEAPVDDFMPCSCGVKPTNRKRKRQAVKEEATRLHSKIVRQTKGPLCQDGCGRLATDAAHIIPRVFAHTRTDIDNAFA